jgi:hypothetical protein
MASATTAPAIGIDVVTAPPAVKPKLLEGHAQSDPPVEVAAPVRAEAVVPVQPEAALTVVIRSDQASPAVPVAALASSAETSPPTAAEAPVALVAPVAPVALVSGASVPVPNRDAVAPAPLAAEERNSIAPASAVTDTERKKVMPAIATVPAGTHADVGMAHAPQNVTPQGLAGQGLPVKAEAPKASEVPLPKNDVPRLPAAAAEPVPAEKTAAQPLRSVALEFTPDGARDVRVRLSERAGEVHVSLHSSDPSITKNLREGVTDLASVLERAGYDAKAWTSGRQHQENPQQPEDAAPQRRGKVSGDGTESFDGLMQDGVMQGSVLE